MDIKLMQTKNDELKINKVITGVKWFINCFIVILILFTASKVDGNRLLLIAIIVVSYINLVLFMKFIINSFRVGLTWRNIDECINEIELKSLSIENIEDKLIRDDEYQYFLGKQYGKILVATNKIVSRVSRAVENINKNEKMNISLVSNVTNKLERPLDSILESIQGLKENIDYDKTIEVLKDKSNNMKIIIDELFEAAKLSSGDIDVNIDVIEISALLRQAIIEYKEKMDTSNIIFKVNIPKDKVYVKCDGEKMWRVFDIVLQNTLKHSLEGSRVYIDLITEDKQVYIKLRNISKDGLNIASSELVNIIKNNKEEDRSGLGIEIAKNLVLLQNGQFILDIEADLFIVNIIYPIHDMKESDCDDK